MWILLQLILFAFNPTVTISATISTTSCFAHSSMLQQDPTKAMSVITKLQLQESQSNYAIIPKIRNLCDPMERTAANYQRTSKRYSSSIDEERDVVQLEDSHIDSDSMTASTITSNIRQRSSAASKILLLTILSSIIAIMTVIAQSDIVPGLYYRNSSDMFRDIGVTLFAAASSTLLINGISSLASSPKTTASITSNGIEPSLLGDNNAVVTSTRSTPILSSRDTRKLIHTLSAPLFCFLWPFYSDNSLGGQMYASAVVLTQTIKLLFAGLGLGGKDEESLATAVSRSGGKEEAFGGPFIYCIVLFCTVVFFWKENIACGLMTVSAMAAGDGMADIVGRRWGSTNKWIFSEKKSIAGSLAFILFSSLCAVSLISWFQFMHVMTPTIPFLVPKVLGISTLCAIVELFPVIDDNITVPLCAAVFSYLLFSIG